MQMCADLFYSCGFNVTLEPSFKILNCEVFSHVKFWLVSHFSIVNEFAFGMAVWPKFTMIDFTYRGMQNK